MNDYVIVLTTFPVEANAEMLAEQLVGQKLAACVNILPPMRSVYRWKGATERADERQLLIKTTAACLPALEASLRALHPYDVPEFVVVPITNGSPPYLDWLSESTKK